MATVLAPPTAPILPTPKRTPRLANHARPVIALRSAGQRLVSVCAPPAPAAAKA
jgi:hypothetical protein